MQPVWIAVAILFTVGLTLLLVVAIGSAWYLLVQMRKLQAAADASVRALQELTSDGAVSALSKSARALAAELPEGLIIIRQFNQSMAAFAKAVFQTEQTPTATPPESGSAFYGYDETRAAQTEVIRRHEQEKVTLTDQQKSQMRTEPPKPVPADILPPKPADAESALTEPMF